MVLFFTVELLQHTHAMQNFDYAGVAHKVRGQTHERNREIQTLEDEILTRSVMSKPRDIPLRELSYDEGHQHNFNEKTSEPHQHRTSINPGTDRDQDRNELQISGKQRNKDLTFTSAQTHL